MKRSLLLAVFAVLLAMLDACAGSGTAARSVPAPVPSATAAVVNTPTAIPSRSIAEMKASAPTAAFLDGVHYRAGKPCEGCHGSLPVMGTPAVPTQARCLPCHGGTYAALASMTSALGDRNPHDAHPGQLACTQCHHVHRPFELYCNACHSMSIPAKFKAGTTL